MNVFRMTSYKDSLPERTCVAVRKVTESFVKQDHTRILLQLKVRRNPDQRAWEITIKQQPGTIAL